MRAFHVARPLAQRRELPLAFLLDHANDLPGGDVHRRAVSRKAPEAWATRGRGAQAFMEAYYAWEALLPRLHGG